MKDPAEVQQFAQQVGQLTEALARLSGSMPGQFETWGKSGEAAAKRTGAAWQKALNPAEQKASMEAMANVSYGAFSRMTDRIIGEAKRMKAQMTDAFGLKFDPNFNPFGNAVGSMKSAMQGDLRGMISNISSGIPLVGGLLGMMLTGREQETKFMALGQQAAQTFKQVGSVGKGVAMEMAGDIKQLSLTGMAAEGDIAAIGAAFASMGVTADMATKDLGGKIGLKGIRDTAITETLQLDKLFQNAAGTGARTVGQVMAQMNSGLEDAVAIYKDVSLASREAGMSQQMFVGSVMQASSAMRIQGADVRQLGEALLKIQNNYEGQGMGAERSADLARAGLQGISGAVRGMSTGMMGHIGQMIDPSLSGVQSVVKMERGMRGTSGESDFFNQAMSKMIEVADQAAGGGSEEDLLFAMEKLFPQLGPEGADALLAMKKDMSAGMTLQEAAGKHQEALKRAFQDEGEKMDELVKIARQLQSSFANLGSGFLSTFIVGIRSIETLLRWGFETLASYFREYFGDADEDKEVAFRDKLFGGFAQTMNKFATANDEAFAQTKKAMGDVEKALPGALNVMTRHGVTGKTPMDKILNPSMDDVVEDHTPGVTRAEQKAANLKNKHSSLLRTPNGNRFQVNIIELGSDGTVEQA